jgi:hypothetical protein
MRTIKTTVYSFDELNDSAKEKAIENIREDYYRDNDFAEWVIDDCCLLEPEELKNEDSILIENNRKVYFDLGRNKHIDISQAMEIKDDERFLEWLGIKKDDFLDENRYSIIEYRINSDSIEFDTTDWNVEFTKEQEDILNDAKIKFKNHCNYILDRIEMGIEYRYSDEGITEDIYSNDWEFTEDGSKY